MRWMIVVACGLALGCDSASEEPAADIGADTDDAVDVAEEPEGSFYDFTVVLPPEGLQQRFNGEIDVTQIAFGSSHIAPAVSLAAEIVYSKPFATFTFNLGFVVGSNSYDVTIDDVGAWTWGSGQQNAPPAFKITVKDAQGIQRVFASWPDGAQGSYEILQWGIEEGDVVAGTLSGTLVDAQNPDVQASVEGELRIVLPARDGGR